MRHLLRASLLAALALGSCGYGYVGFGWVWWYPCCGYYDYPDSCCDYAYDAWNPDSVAAADFDEDGAVDLAVADGAAGKLWFARGLPGGGYEPQPTVRADLPRGLPLLEPLKLDSDAGDDLVLLHGLPGDFATYVGDGRGDFSILSSAPIDPPHPGSGPQGVRFARGALDGDAFDDIAYLAEDGAVHVALGTGAGTFHDLGHVAGVSAFLGPDAASRLDDVHLALADFVSTPATDLLVLDGQRGLLAILPGRGDGTFDPGSPTPFPALGHVLGIAPMTTDGPGAHLAVLFGSPTGVPPTSVLALVDPATGELAIDGIDVGTTRSLFARDLDGDGVTDLLLADPEQRRIRTVTAHHAP